MKISILAPLSGHQYSDYVAKRTDANTPSGSYDIPVAGFVKKETTKNVTVHNDLGPENEKSESVLIPEHTLGNLL